jgi:hypothetical protein
MESPISTHRVSLERGIEMPKTPSPLFHCSLAVALVVICLITPTSAQQKNQTTASAPPSLSLAADTTVVSACSGSLSKVQLNARANSPSGNPIRYTWSTTGGRITGDGPNVNWDLTGLAPGVYRASIEIATGSIAGECQAFTSAAVVVKPCAPTIQPSCPRVEISCPTNISVDQPVSFSAIVAGGSPITAPIYNWTVSGGTIIDGQGTSLIKVDTHGLAGQTIKATLTMGGHTLDCSATCTLAIPIPGAKPRKFDEFPDISRNDEKARLDNYVIELQNDPTATAYVLVYPARSRKTTDAQKHSSRIIDYLVNSRGIDARRIVTMVGGAREELKVELWIAPQGAKPPSP